MLVMLGAIKEEYELVAASFTENSPHFPNLSLSLSAKWRKITINHNPSKIFHLESEQKQGIPPKTHEYSHKNTTHPTHLITYSCRLQFQPLPPRRNPISQFTFLVFRVFLNLSTLVGTGSVFLSFIFYCEKHVGGGS